MATQSYLRILYQSLYQAYPSGHCMWTSTAAVVTASLDETVLGRMYSGTVRCCACLTTRAPGWYLKRFWDQCRA